MVVCAWTGVSLIIGCPAFAAASPQQAEAGAGQAGSPPEAPSSGSQQQESEKSEKRDKKDKANSADKSAAGSDDSTDYSLSLKRLPRDFVSDQKEIWTSPFHLRFSDTEWLVALAGISAGLLVTDERIKLISFTGSAAVGWAIKNNAGKKKVVLELGGNAGVIVHSDADLAYAAGRCVTGGFSYAGQTCISVQRILV